MKQVDKWVHAKPVLSRARLQFSLYYNKRPKFKQLKINILILCERNCLIRSYRTRATFHIDLIDFYRRILLDSFVSLLTNYTQPFCYCAFFISGDFFPASARIYLSILLHTRFRPLRSTIVSTMEKKTSVKFIGLCFIWTMGNSEMFAMLMMMILKR